MRQDFTPAIRQALRAEPDYSESFTRRVAGISQSLSERLGVKTGHGRSMNYRSAQSIEIHVDPNGKPVDYGSDQAIARLLVLISSRGPLFTIVGLKRIGIREWAPVDAQEVPGAPQLLPLVEGHLITYGLEAVKGELLNRMVEGRTTELDGAPASVMQVLFAEII